MTDAEKAKVADEVKKANPTAKDVEVGKDGTATVTFPDGSTASLTPEKTAKTADSNGLVDPEVTPVKDPANLTDAEKTKVEEAVKKANPTATKVEVGNDGTTTVTFPDGSTASLTPEKTAKTADSNGLVDPEVTPVKDPANLTDAEKTKVEEAVKKANPTATKVEVGNDGTTTVTFPDGSTASLTPEKTAKTADSNGLVDPEVTPVKDPANLTDAEKTKVEEAVKKANPTATKVEVGNDGTTTVTFPDGSTAEIPAAKAVEKAKDAEGVKDPEAKTPVKDPANLTDAEKAKVADEVKKANPTAKDVEVGKDGTATVTFPDGSTAEIPAAKAVEKAKDAEGVKDPEAKTPVKDPANLTDAEKAKVADEVKKANPTAKDVEVGKDGTATVTFPDGSTAEIPAAKAVEKAKDAEGVKDPEAKTPVKDPANLTDAEKAKVADEVKKANPTAKDVEVGKDGTVTVTFPDGSTTTVTPDKTVKSADSNGAKDPSVTPVKDPANLTDAEKAKVVDEVKKSNPTAKDVEVGKDGTVTVTFPDGSTAVIPAAKAVAKAKDSEGVQNPSKPATDAGKNTPVAQDQTAKPANKSKDSEGVKAPSATSVKDPSNLTDAEKAKVADEVKKSNPTATDVKVGKDGTTTVSFPDGSTAVIPADKAVAKANDSEGVQDPSATAVKDPSNLTDADKAKAASNASQATSAQANARKGAKELPNTGTADSTVAMVAAAASALLGLGLAGRRRKEDEEA
ncbi:gram positive anchor [Streptococcus mitis SK569]|nr:gram positive anchor [Streptococcus mitis SK569]